jgi:hypothetical protein
MKKSVKMYVAGALLCIAALFVTMACEKDEKSAPGAAGAITGATENVCPTPSVDLSVGEIEGATSYQWYRNGTALDGATMQTYTVTQSGTYTVAGVNSEGEGAKSPAKVVTVEPCNPPAAGTIEGATANRCPVITVDLSVGEIENADSYQWYRDDAIIDGATAQTYTVIQSGTYTVAGINVNGEGDQSPAHVVTVSACVSGAGEITATIRCPDEGVLLSVEAIEGAVSYQWYNGGDPIRDATASTYIATVSGRYCVAGVSADRDEGTKSEYKSVQVTPCIPDKPMAVGMYGASNSPSSATSCTSEGGVVESLQLIGGISLRATSYTWYITKTENGTPEKLTTIAYDQDNLEGVLRWAATETGTYTTTGSNEYGESEHSTGFYFEVKTASDCALTAPPQEAPGSFRVSTGSKIDNGDGSWSNECEGDIRALTLAWNATPGASSYVIKNLTTSKDSVVDNWTSCNVTFGNDGTYTVRARNPKGDGPESEGIAIRIVECQLAAPSFAKKPAGNYCPATTAVAEVNMVSNAAGYEWFNNGASVDLVTSTSFTITQTGVYTVKAISATGMRGKESTESISVTIGDCSGASIASRADLLGAWTANDKKGEQGMLGVTWSDNTYAVGITAGGGGNNEILIENIGDLGSGGATVKATVVINAEPTDGVYGTVTIAEQNVTKYGDSDNLQDTKFSAFTASFFSTTYGGDVTADIVILAGKPTFVIKNTYAIKPSGDPLARGGGDGVTFVKKQ